MVFSRTRKYRIPEMAIASAASLVAMLLGAWLPIGGLRVFPYTLSEPIL